MNNKKISILFFAFGIILIIGAIMGYINAHSYISLIAGGSFGIGILIGALLITKRKLLGFYLSFILSVLVAIVFFVRYMRTGATFPGIMALVSSAVVIIGFILTQGRRKKLK
jgi:uncharacterized membrane protein (UPF0136 family)